METYTTAELVQELITRFEQTNGFEFVDKGKLNTLLSICETELLELEKGE